MYPGNNQVPPGLLFPFISKENYWGRHLSISGNPQERDKVVGKKPMLFCDILLQIPITSQFSISSSLSRFHPEHGKVPFSLIPIKLLYLKDFDEGLDWITV